MNFYDHIFLLAWVFIFLYCFSSVGAYFAFQSWIKIHETKFEASKKVDELWVRNHDKEQHLVKAGQEISLLRAALYKAEEQVKALGYIPKGKKK